MDGIRTCEHPLRYPKKRTVPMMEIRQHLHDITHLVLSALQQTVQAVYMK